MPSHRLKLNELIEENQALVDSILEIFDNDNHATLGYEILIKYVYDQLRIDTHPFLTIRIPRQYFFNLFKIHLPCA